MYIINAVSSSYLWYGVIYTNDSIPTKHWKNLWICERAPSQRAWFFFEFSHSKTAISFNILLVLLILYLRNIVYFQVSNYNLYDTYMYIINAVSCSYLWYGVIYINDSIPTKHWENLWICERAPSQRAWFFFEFSHSKTAISFNILLVLLILYLRNIVYFQVSNYNLYDTYMYIIDAVSCSYLWYGVIYTNDSIPTKHWHWKNLCICERA